MQPDKVRPDRGGYGGIGEKIGPGARAPSGNDAVALKVFAVEEYPRAQALQPFRTLIARVRGGLYAELGQKALRGVAVGKGRFNAHRAAERQVGAALMTEFVALGVSAEVVVIVEQEDLAGAAECLAIKIRRRQAGDAGADHHQIVLLAGVRGLDRARVRAVPELVGDFE